MLRRLPSLLFDPTGPLVVRPSYLPHLISWGIRLLAAARPKRQAQIVKALSSLNQQAIASYQPLLAAAGAEALVDINGSLVVCRTMQMLEQKAASIPLLRSHNVRVERIGREETLRLEPALSPDVAGAIFLPENARCVSPGALGRRFADSVLTKGGAIVRAAVTELRPDNDGWCLVTSNGNFRVRNVVVAAGRWSDKLLKALGYKAPLASERGYHLMLPVPQVSLARPVVMAEPFFAATPMTDGLRLAGTAEFATADASPDPRRSDVLFKLAQPYLPGLSGAGATRWMGVRPSFPDALPAIGRASRHNNLFYSFGHQHVGLTQAAVSARLLTEIIHDQPSSIDPRPFSLNRFDRDVRRRVRCVVL